MLLNKSVAGPQGVPGPTGPIGPIGPQGRIGNTGNPGPQGPIGIGGTGAKGPQGPQGKIGPQGPQGKTGYGSPGLTGNTGPQGKSGNTGAVGPQGPAGKDGIGLTGAQGPRGYQGIPGSAGEGSVGPVGPRGDTGPVGPKGDTGAEGARGPKGDTGSMGPMGYQGPVGPGGEGSVGPAGPKGDTGATGPAGADGATGPKGDTGPAGPAGADGAPGPKGDTGAPGPTGEQGPVGPGGEGSLGPTGPAGPAGADGAPGPKGDTGATGPTGPEGPTLVSSDAGNKASLGSDSKIMVNDFVTGNYLPINGGDLQGDVTVHGNPLMPTVDYATLKVNPTLGSPNPNNPFGGDAFDTLMSVSNFINTKYKIINLTIRLSAGSHILNGFFNSPSWSVEVRILGNDNNNRSTINVDTYGCFVNNSDMFELKDIITNSINRPTVKATIFYVNTNFISPSYLALNNCDINNGENNITLLASNVEFVNNNRIEGLVSGNIAVGGIVTHQCGTDNTGDGGTRNALNLSSMYFAYNDLTDTPSAWHFTGPNKLVAIISPSGIRRESKFWPLGAQFIIQFGGSTWQTDNFGNVRCWGVSAPAGQILFPVAYSTSIPIVTLSPKSAGVYVSNVTKTGFTLAGGSADWISIGY